MIDTGTTPPNAATHTMDSSLGARIRVLRGAETQTAFGARVGLTQGNVSRLENGADPDTATLAAICRACNVSADWLLFGDATTEPARKAGRRGAR